MIDNSKKYTPVLKHESIQIIMPYELFKVSDANNGDVLWYEVTFSKPSTLDEAVRRPFPSEEIAKDYIIGELTHRESIHK